MSLSLLSLSLIPLPARAQSYGPPIYTSPGAGATFGSPSTTYPYGSYNGYGGGGPGPASCAGQMKATFTWSGGSGNAPPPQTVIVTQTGSASWQVYGDSGSCDDGLGDAAAPSTVAPFSPGNGTPWPFNSAVSQGTHYKTQSGGASVEVDCTPTASVPRGDGAADCAVAYSAAVSPVTIFPGGATSDGSGGYDILIGQHCAPVLKGFPTQDGSPDSGGWSATYNWSVTGTTFQSWTVSSDSTYTTEVDGPGPLNVASPGWYWDDPSQTTETITCTATVTPPAGEGSSFSVTVSQSIGVYTPNWTGQATGGAVGIKDQYPDPDATGWVLYAGPASPSETAGMVWNATEAPPTGTTFGDGTLSLVQLVTPDRSFSVSSGSYAQNLPQGLDSQYPYGWNTSPPTTPNYKGQDSPAIGLTVSPVGGTASAAMMKDNFVDYLMYTPPGGVAVPVGQFSWGTNATVIEPTGGWGGGTAGTVTPQSGKFTANNSFPKWTSLINKNTPYVQQ